MALLAQTEIQSAVDKLDGWTYSDNAIHKTITFDTYMDGIRFVNQLAEHAEAINHHPDLTVGWCQVRVTFTSHDQGGVTDQCIAMAKAVHSIL
jgi:4a-hydroxytetrahydrobiopterin dehydratase|tara:strand:+ start:185 stop:463 length:279 start_codon:yes stop_codon:yes gene_type:complete